MESLWSGDRFETASLALSDAVRVQGRSKTENAADLLKSASSTRSIFAASEPAEAAELGRPSPFVKLSD